MTKIDNAIQELNKIVKNIRPNKDYRSCVNCKYGIKNRFTIYGKIIIECIKELNDPKEIDPHTKFITTVQRNELNQKNTRYYLKNKEFKWKSFFNGKCNNYKYFR